LRKVSVTEFHELFSVPPSPESSMERLHRDIIKEIREVIVEVLEKALGVCRALPF